MCAENDIKVIKNEGGTLVYNAEDRSTSGLTATMKAGEPVKVGGTGTNFVTLIATGDPEVGTDEFIGIVRKESTETSAADGKVEVTVMVPMRTMLRGSANDYTKMNTAALLLGLQLDWITFDYDDTNFTIDENEGTDPNAHGLQIINGDIAKYTVDVIVHAGACSAGPLTGQTID